MTFLISPILNTYNYIFFIIGLNYDLTLESILDVKNNTNKHLYPL